MDQAFPFPAIVGQQPLKTALLLTCIDPRIGGVLVSGPRGSAKSTLVRSLTALRDDHPFITLPLGASEEMITGTFDLEKVLEDSSLAFRPGLLAKADRGLLYVDEVNLLADHLVDLLLDSAASGRNIVERDGISHEHPARFILVGTMNPDEGELRPQLMDRFGLFAQVQTKFDIEERKKVVANRLAFDRDPDSFVEAQSAETNEIKQLLDKAVEGLARVAMPDNIANEIAQRCAEANIEGMRADIIMHRAATAHAALHQRGEVVLSDVNAVASLVLDHRRNEQSPPSQSGNESGPVSGSDPNPRTDGGSSIQGAWGAGAMKSSPVELRQEFAGDREWTGDPSYQSGRRGRMETNGGVDSARFATRPGAQRKPDWIRTLGSNPGFSRMNPGERRKSLRYRHALPGAVLLDLVLLDTSASTLAGRGLDRARGLVSSLSKTGYRERRHLGIITFGNDRVHTLLQPQRAPKDAGAVLDGLTCGGGTPFSKALDTAHLLLQRHHARASLNRVYIITDGRFDAPPVQHPLLQNCKVTFVDIESGRVRLGLTERLASQVEADYHRVGAVH